MTRFEVYEIVETVAGNGTRLEDYHTEEVLVATFVTEAEADTFMAGLDEDDLDYYFIIEVEA